MDEKKTAIDVVALLSETVAMIDKCGTTSCDPYMVIATERTGKGFCKFAGNTKDEIAFLFLHLKTFLGEHKKRGLSKGSAEMAVLAILAMAFNETYKSE